MTDQAGTPPTKKTIDLDAARAARREKLAPAPELVFLGETYVLPRELPAEAVHAFGAIMAEDFSGLEGGMKALFGADGWDALVKAAKDAGDPLAFEDEIFLLEQAFDAYGMTLPESSASESSS